MKSAIFCDYGKHVGGGHLRRCEILKQQLLARGHSATIFLNTSCSMFSPKFCKNEDYNYDILIFDTNFDISDFLLRCKKDNVKSVGLDYFGTGTLDVNFVVFPHTIPTSQSVIFTGFDYVIIDPAYRQFNKDLSGFGAVVSIGSSDYLSQSHLVSELLSENGFSVTLVEGPLSGVVPKRGDYDVVRNPHNFKQIISSADLVITNGGGTLFEALHQKRKIVAMPQTRKELNIVNEIKLRHSIIGSGLDCVKNLTPDSVRGFNPTGKTLIDGFGYDRILDQILSEH